MRGLDCKILVSSKYISQWRCWSGFPLRGETVQSSSTEAGLSVLLTGTAAPRHLVCFRKNSQFCCIARYYQTLNYFVKSTFKLFSKSYSACVATWVEGKTITDYLLVASQNNIKSTFFFFFLVEHLYPSTATHDPASLQVL